MAVWLTPSERAEFDERVAAAGVTAPEFMRSRIFEYRLPQRTKTAFSEETLSELKAVGHKLNQLARRANMTGEIEPQELSEALRHWTKTVGLILDSKPVSKTDARGWEKTEHEQADEERQWAECDELEREAAREVAKQSRYQD
jgi:hypothetical protein